MEDRLFWFMSDDSGTVCYTALTFAPVQSFIRSSRKLRDLYGSSLLLSHLAHAICADAAKFFQQSDAVISPAGVEISQGVPNTLVIRGHYPEAQARAALLKAWAQVLNSCRQWLERKIQVEKFDPLPEGWRGWNEGWGASWKAAANHSWELFVGHGGTIHAARDALEVKKQQRDWSVPNWTGESSTLSSAEAVVRPTMARVIQPWKVDAAMAAKEASAMLAQLRAELGEAFAGLNEEISLLELVKRLITYQPILQPSFELDQPLDDGMVKALLRRFPPLSTRQDDGQEEKPESIIWFMADGDEIGSHLTRMAQREGEEEALRNFSGSMRSWAASLYGAVPRCLEEGATNDKAKATVVYAGGDDLLGALHESDPGAGDLSTADLWRWLLEFPSLWKEAKQPELTISMGVVWADATVPQREALQHARDAEASAKSRGRDRFALRLLYASGNHLEWSCPWCWLNPILHSYCDRHGRTLEAANDGKPPSWRHLAEDLVWLQERQAITPEVADALWQAYFPACVLPDPQPSGSTIEGRYRASLKEPEQGRDFALWLLDLGRVMAGLEKRREAVA